MNKTIKKIITLLTIVGISLTSVLNCFGKFALTRTVYTFNTGIGNASWTGKIVRTLVMYVYFLIPIIAGLVWLIDVLILNLIEFWTDSNPMGLNEYNKEGKYVKKIEQDGESLKLTYLNFGQKLVIDINNKNKSEQFVVLRSEPGKFFKETDDQLEEIIVNPQTVGSKVILKMAINGKLQSSKVIDIQDYNELEEKFVHEFQ
ncbi:DUF3332 family protein [Leptospira sp. GIMC2001]|uniref:DUF3332 family protein n=1 Tax=Leptospira sp. GIMC2001 TaxID=1513297 RepID=UPI0023493D04|nr:DUF3332 family protein [Leptospira sp. GIMC2001]WCL49714.1 DUF3332 family protein [Leptospira sp. GIMC2001]